MLKKVIKFSILFLFCPIFAHFTSSCNSTKRPIDDRNILKYQQEIDRLEEELRTRDRTIESAVRELGAITSRSQSVEGTVDELIELFEEYQRRVDKLLYDYDKIRTETKNQS